MVTLDLSRCLKWLWMRTLFCVHLRFCIQYEIYKNIYLLSEIHISCLLFIYLFENTEKILKLMVQYLLVSKLNQHFKLNSLYVWNTTSNYLDINYLNNSEIGKLSFPLRNKLKSQHLQLVVTLSRVHTHAALTLSLRRVVRWKVSWLMRNEFVSCFAIKFQMCKTGDKCILSRTQTNTYKHALTNICNSKKRSKCENSYNSDKKDIHSCFRSTVVLKYPFT